MDLYQQYLAGTILKPCIEEINCIISPEDWHNLTRNVRLEFASVSRAGLEMKLNLTARYCQGSRRGRMCVPFLVNVRIGHKRNIFEKKIIINLHGFSQIRSRPESFQSLSNQSGRLVYSPAVLPQPRGGMGSRWIFVHQTLFQMCLGGHQGVTCRLDRIFPAQNNHRYLSNRSHFPVVYRLINYLGC